MQNKSKQAFTLIELIVVITILAILGTIAFISLQGYSASARDSKRISDISNIKKSLELFSLNTGKYPKPDDYNTVSYIGELIWYQGTVGDQVSTNLSRNLNEKPTDPSTNEEYTYSTTNSQTEYEILGLYENNMLSNVQLFEKTNAANFSFAKVEGNYNGLYARTSSFYIPTPSIINGNVWGNVDFAEDETLIESQVVTGGDNIPGVSTGGLDITLSPYEGVITSNSTEEEKQELVEAIQTAYSGSVLVNDTTYADVLTKTSTGEMVEFVDVVVLEIAEYSTFASGGGYSGGGEDGSELGEWNIAIACAGANSGYIVYESTNNNDKTGLTCEHDIAICSGDETGYIISACNLGATTASTDWTVSGGKYFQWGRNKGFTYEDNTQKSSPIQNANYNPSNDLDGFVWHETVLESYRYDWIVSRNSDLWGDITATDIARQGPCPIGYHVPTETEWSEIILLAGWGNSGSSLQSALLLPYAGYRVRSDGSMNLQNEYGYYWSSSSAYNRSMHLGFNSNSINNYSHVRAGGLSIRCFKN